MKSLLSRSRSSSSSTSSRSQDRHEPTNDSGNARHSWHSYFHRRTRSTGSQTPQGGPESPALSLPSGPASQPDCLPIYLQVPSAFLAPFSAPLQPSSPVPSLSYTPPSPVSPATPQSTFPSPVLSPALSPTLSPALSPTLSPAFSQMDLGVPASTTPSIRPSSALGLVDETYHTVDFDEPHEPGISSEQFYGSLIGQDGKPSEVLKRLADALFFYIDGHCEDTRLRHTRMIEPAKYGWLMHKMSEKAADVVVQNIQSYYDAGHIPYKFHTIWSGESLPCLDRRAWLHLVVYKVKAGPDEAHKCWSNILEHFELQDPQTHEAFPTSLPRSALPSGTDRQAHDAYDSWRGKVARKVQAPMREAQRMQQQQAVNAMFAQFGMNDQRPPWMNQSPFMTGQIPCSPMPAMASYPNPATGSMWNQGGIGAGTAQGQMQRQPSQRNIDDSGSSGGGAVEAFLNVTTAALNFASAEVGGNGGGNGGNDNNGNAAGPEPNWTVNFGPSGGGFPGYNDGFGNNNGFGSGFNSGPGFGNGFGASPFPSNGGFGNSVFY